VRGKVEQLAPPEDAQMHPEPKVWAAMPLGLGAFYALWFSRAVACCTPSRGAAVCNCAWLQLKPL
jgi:hypothetical protein